MVRREKKKIPLCMTTWNRDCVLFWKSRHRWELLWKSWRGHEKCISQPPHNEMKCVLSIKELYSKGEKVKIFTFAYCQVGRGGPPTPPQRVDHGGRLIGSKLFWPRASPACASSKSFNFKKMLFTKSCFNRPFPWTLAHDPFAWQRGRECTSRKEKEQKPTPGFFSWEQQYAYLILNLRIAFLKPTVNI